MPERLHARAIAVGACIALTLGFFSLDYTVKRGDTLGRIARDNDVTLEELVELNDITNPNLIYPGQVLLIPGVDDIEPDIIHTVVRGDTLSRIAARYDTTLSALVEANSISNPNLIRVGQHITIPGTGGGATSVPSPTDPEVRTGRSHIVQRGEDLDAIASQYPGVTPEQIAASNGITNGVIYAGTRLFLDGPAFIAEGSEGEKVYTVVRGDRLGDIAASNDTTVKTLVELNGISNPNFIRAGQELIVPTGQAWMCPLDDASFFNDWGFPRGGGSRFHEGNDLFTEYGSPVYASVPGLVEQKIGALGGNQVNLHGDDGVEYIFSHLSAFAKSGRVRAGEVIGFVGTSGSAQGTPPHVHFGIYLDDGVVVNPYPTLAEHGCKR